MSVRSLIWIAMMALLLYVATIFVHSTEHPIWHPNNCTVTAPDNPQPLPITCHP